MTLLINVSKNDLENMYVIMMNVYSFKVYSVDFALSMF
jgi:hypothetical protein